MTTRAQTSHRKNGFLAEFRKHGNVSTACETLDLDRSTVYQWRKRDEVFAKDWDEAELEATEHMEAEAYRRAVEGVEEPIVANGRVIGVVRKYSDTLLIFQLKARAPEKYRDNYSVEHTGKDGAPLGVTVFDLMLAAAKQVQITAAAEAEAATIEGVFAVMPVLGVGTPDGVGESGTRGPRDGRR